MSEPRRGDAMVPETMPLILAAAVLLSGDLVARRSMVSSPQVQAAESLLLADRNFAADAQRSPTRTVFAAMLADSVMWQAPQGFVRGREAALAALDASPDAATSRLRWSPIRAGVSADGQHGFTFGYMTQLRADSSKVPLKYMAYWMRSGDTWQVLAYKRARASDAPTDTALMPASLPAAVISPVRDPAVIAAHRRSLMDAERAFAAEALRIGQGNAFAVFGLEDAVNMGGGTQHMVKGNTEIARAVSPGGDMSAAPNDWGPDAAFVASSGDLGITFGRIRPRQGGGREVPFFTIWRRVEVGGPWRYVAE